MAVIELPEFDEPAAMASTVADRFGLPAPTLGRVMSDLAKAGVLQSERGVKGGFRLARPARNITALEVYEAINGTIANWDFLPENVPAVWQQNVTDVFDHVVDDVRKRLGKTTVADLRAGRSQGR